MCDFKMKYQRNLTGHNVNMVQHKARENIKAKLIPVKSVIIKPQSEDIYITTSE